jgi:hypothetical protein
MHHRIVRLIAKADETRAALRRTIRDVVLKCKHEHVAEDDGAPPWRICLDCGLTDEGWGCGFQFLTNNRKGVGSIDHDEAIKLRTTSVWQRNYGQSLAEQIDRFPF